jgi:PIN domain nuclease of toxin-antitoxin system
MSGVLLDTCAVIMMVAQNRMRAEARQSIIEAGLGDGILISPVTAWEVGLLARRQRPGARTFLPDVQTWISRVMAKPGIRPAAFSFEIALASSTLPDPFHDDPADRLLVTTARFLHLPIVTCDRRTEGKRQRKRFFFEKKNQKTLTDSG